MQASPINIVTRLHGILGMALEAIALTTRSLKVPHMKDRFEIPPRNTAAALIRPEFSGRSGECEPFIQSQAYWVLIIVAIEAWLAKDRPRYTDR
jgi:hypothetical protein